MTIERYTLTKLNENKLRIAHVFYSLEPAPWGGVMTFLGSFLNCLDKTKTENFIVAYEAPIEPCKKFEDMGIPIFSRLQEKPIQSVKSIEVTQWLIQTFEQIKPHVVQTHVGPGEMIARLAASYAKVPVIVCRENNVHEKVTEKHRSLSLRLAKITDRLVCISEAVRQYSCEVEKIPNSRTTIIYNGLQLNEYVFQAIEPTNQFVYVGRLEPQKASLRLLQAFSTIVSEYPDSHLSLIGDGSLMSDCQEYIRYLKLDDRVHFLGYRTKPWQYAPLGSIFVHCCDYEGFGTAITEAMACGHLCILPKVGGIPEVAENGSEAIFYEGDCDNLVAAMRCALEMPVSQKLQIIKAARSRVERDFDARRMTEQYLDLYQTLYTQKQEVFNP
jgi:glycosyltransferase involved in cell wall biosynthesis